MNDWRSIALHGCRSITRTVDVFEIGAPPACPFAFFKMKVLERSNGSFLTVPNVARIGRDGSADWTSGLGDSAIESLQDAIRHFVESVGDVRELTDDEFAWADPSDF